MRSLPPCRSAPLAKWEEIPLEDLASRCVSQSALLPVAHGTVPSLLALCDFAGPSGADPSPDFAVGSCFSSPPAPRTLREHLAAQKCVTGFYSFVLGSSFCLKCLWCPDCLLLSHLSRFNLRNTSPLQPFPESSYKQVHPLGTLQILLATI